MARTKKDATEGLNGALVRTILGEMKARQISREELARRSEIPFDSLRRYLSTSPASARMLDVELVGAISEALGMTPAALVGRAQELLAEDPAARRRGLTAAQFSALLAAYEGGEDPRQLVVDHTNDGAQLVTRDENLRRALEDAAALDDEDLETFSPRIRALILAAREDLAKAAAAKDERGTA